MVAALVNSSTSGTTDTQSATKNCPVPTGAASGHVAVLKLEVWLDTATDPVITWPAGFTQVAYVESITDGFQRLYIARKVLTAADTGNYTMSWSGSYWNQAQCTLWSGIDNTTPLDVAVNTATTVANTTQAANSLTTVTDGCGLIHVVANENSATGTPPTGYTERQEANYLRTNTKVAGSAGTETPSGATISVSTVKLGALIALRPASSGGTAMNLAAATETDTAQSLTAAKVWTPGAAAESDAAQPVTLAKALTFAASTETDAALPLSSSKLLALGPAAETGTALPMSLTKSLTLARSTETDAAQQMTLASGSGPTPMPLAVAAETDTARALTAAKALALPASSETDVAQPLILSKAWTAPGASESDQARPVSLSKAPALAVAGSPEQARAMTFSKSLTLARAAEVDTALQMALGAGVEYDPATTWTATTRPSATAGTRGKTATATSRQLSYAAITRSEQ